MMLQAKTNNKNKGMSRTNLIKDDKGMAMILALTLTCLLALLGIWMAVQTQTAFRITTAATRYESVFNLAEAALQLSMRCVRMNTLFPPWAHLNTSVPVAITTGLPDYVAESEFAGGVIIPEIYYLGFDKNPPAGWMLNWQGYSAFHKVHYMCRGEGKIPMPSTQGDADTAIVSLASRVTQ